MSMENSMDLPQPDKLRFVGPVKDEAKVETAKQYLETNKPAMPTEIEKSPEREQQVVGMIAALSEFTRNELGIDLSKRLPQKEKIHFFDKKRYREVRKMHQFRSNCHGTYFTSGHILVEEEPTIEGTLNNAQHEMIHVASFRSIDLREIGEKLWTLKDRSGYANERNQALSMIDEALTEMTNLEVMVNNWKNQSVLNQMCVKNTRAFGYISQIIVIDELIKRVADKNGREYRGVLRELQRGKFLGEMQALRVLTDEIGKDGMKMLARWTLHPNESIKIAQSLGLIDAQAKLQALGQGQDVQVMDRIAPNIVYKQSTKEKVLRKMWHSLQVNF